jgi:hypothetical protein
MTAWPLFSATCHQEHFGEAFGLSTHDCEVAHSACVGFGMERMVLDLIWSHGFESAMWLTRVRTNPGRTVD